MSKHSIVGSGSYMPEDIFLKKYEMTCIYEDPEQLNNHFRNTLKDQRCDAPFFESDAPRRDNYSRDRLNLRYGGRRVNTEPYLPDGTFLDHEFTIKDPRGIALGPDMMQHRRQQEARGRFIKHGNDEDNSVPSTGWNPTHVVRDIKGQFYNVKSRMKIFDESMDGRHNGGTTNTKLSSTGVCLQETDERAPIMQDAMCYNRANYLNDLSNNTSIGWRRTTDHVFQIAKYGQVRGLAPLSEQNWSKNRANARVEHDVLLSWKDQNVSKAISIKMIDMARKKQSEIENGKTMLLSEGRITQGGRNKKLSADDLSGIKSRQTDETHAESPHTALNVFQAPQKMAIPAIDTNKQDKIIIEPYIIEYMASINRKMTPREIDDLREQIEQTGCFYGVLIEQKNKMYNPNTDPNNELLWKSEDNHEKRQSKKIANYSKISASIFINGKNKENLDFERYHKNSKVANQRRGQLTNELYNMNVLDFDNAYGEEINAVKQIGKMGTKYMRNFMEKDDINNDMGDITSVNKY